MYPAGTLVRVIKSDRHAKSSPRANSIGYVANSEELPYFRLSAKKHVVGKLHEPLSIITVELVSVVFVRFGNQTHDRHENHDVVVFKPDLLCSPQVAARHAESVNRLISRNLTPEEEGMVRDRIGRAYKMPWVFIDKHEDAARINQLAESLINNYKFFDYVKRVNSLARSVCIDKAKNPLLELLPLTDILQLADAVTHNNREFCRNLNDSLKKTIEVVHIMFKSAELGTISNEIVGYVTQGLRYHNNNTETVTLQRDFDCIIEDLFYNTNNKLVAKHLDDITKKYSPFRLEEKMGELEAAFENYKKRLVADM